MEIVVGKKWWQSKIIWTEVITAVVAILASLAVEFPELAVIGVLKAALTIVLRVVTYEEITK